MTIRWRLNHEARLYTRQWGEEVVVYDDASGDTHLMDVAGAEALRQLGESELSLDELHTRVADALNLEEGEALRDHIEQLLQRLRRDELVQH